MIRRILVDNPDALYDFGARPLGGWNPFRSNRKAISPDRILL